MFTFWTWQGWSFFVAVGTIGLAIVAVFEEVIRKCHFRICLTDVKPDEDGWVEVWSHYLRVEKLAEKEAEGIFGKP